ncbi:MAG: hypothetical protein KGS72_17195 [Cyanobacteria bacterium REEB67]|nr:hypothetical protein [Cyanobacteria bacterium REEB67]
MEMQLYNILEQSNAGELCLLELRWLSKALAASSALSILLLLLSLISDFVRKAGLFIIRVLSRAASIERKEAYCEPLWAFSSLATLGQPEGVYMPFAQRQTAWRRAGKRTAGLENYADV